MRTWIPYGRVAAWLVAGAVGLLWMAVLATGGARADAFGQIAAWGSPGTGVGQFFQPTEMGVDPRDDSVYVVDQNADQSDYQLQKFSSSGSPIASATIPRPADVDGNPPVLLGVAVDPRPNGTNSNRLYLLQLRSGADTVTGAGAAEQILVYSTQDSGGTLTSEERCRSRARPEATRSTTRAASRSIRRPATC
jgi:hypothetical protein